MPHAPTFALILAGILVAPEPVLLTFRADRGDEMTYATSMTFREGGAVITVKADVTQQVVSVVKGAVTLNNVVRASKVVVDGKETDLTDAGTSRTVMDVSGRVLGIQSARADKNGLRAARASAVVAPNAVSEGEAWTVEDPGDAKLDTRKSKGEYKLVKVAGEGRAQLATIEVNYRELEGRDPIQATGTVIIYTATGWVQSSQLKVKNFPLPGGKAVEAEFTRTAK